MGVISTLGVNDWGSNLCLGVNYASDTSTEFSISYMFQRKRYVSITGTGNFYNVCHAASITQQHQIVQHNR